MQSITTIIHLTYENYSVDIYINNNSGFILPSRTQHNTIIDPNVYEIDWKPTTKMTTYLIIQAFNPQYRKVLKEGQVIGSISLEQEESSIVVYKDPNTPTGLALDIELYYPKDSQVMISIMNTRKAGVEVIEILGIGKERQVHIRKPMKFSISMIICK